MNWVELHPPRSYTVVWQRRGEMDRFRHTVIACSADDATHESQRLVGLGLGPNAALWQVDRVIGTTTETELVFAR